MSGTFNQNTSNANWITGRINLGGTLTQLRITTVNGTDTFDAGTICTFFTNKHLTSKRLIMNKDTQPVNLTANKWHEIEALEDGAVFVNVFAEGKY